MSLLKRILGALAVILVAFGIWKWRHHYDKRTDQQIQEKTLRPNEQEKLVVDPRRHKITTITAKKTTTAYVGNRPYAVVVQKNGNVVVEERKWGTELEPLIGLSYGDTTRLNLGASFFYWHTIDLNGHFALRLDNREDHALVKPVISVSDNIYSNTNLFFGINPFSLPSLDIHGGVFFRL